MHSSLQRHGPCYLNSCRIIYLSYLICAVVQLVPSDSSKNSSLCSYTALKLHIRTWRKKRVLTEFAIPTNKAKCPPISELQSCKVEFLAISKISEIIPLPAWEPRENSQGSHRLFEPPQCKTYLEVSSSSQGLSSWPLLISVGHHSSLTI